MNIGDHVICVNAEGIDPTDFEPSIPVKGGHYVIRDLYPPDEEDHRLGVMLVGIKGLTNFIGWETSFAAERFRLLEEMKEENRRMAEATA
jgi:hypothetical protein